MNYTLDLRATYKNGKKYIYKNPNISGDFIEHGYKDANTPAPEHKPGIISDGCFNLLYDKANNIDVALDLSSGNCSLATEDFTISLWCNIQADSVSQNMVLFSATDGYNHGWSQTAGTFLLLCNPVRLLYANTTYVTSTDNIKLADGKNHFVCIVRKSDKLYVFVDGKKEIEDDLAKRFNANYEFYHSVSYGVCSGSAEDSDGTQTLKRSALIDGFTLVRGIGLWTEDFTVPKYDVWDLLTNGFLDTTGLAHYHNKIIEYINKNSSVRQNNHLYQKDEVVKFNNMWIKCTKGGTTASTAPTVSSQEIGTTITDGGAEWEIIALIETSNKILDWKSNKVYNKGEMVYYGNILYKANTSFTSGTDFSNEESSWDLVCAQIPSWIDNTFYKQGAIVEHDNKIYKCKKANSDSAFTESNWTNIGGGSSVEEWKPNKQYNVNDIVIYNNQLFLCIIKNTSTQEFEDDADEWLLLSASEQNTHKQINKLGAKAKDTFDITVQKTKTFAFPPIEVLKLTNETKGVSENIFDYDSGDGAKFTVNGVLASKSKFIIFDGTAHPNNIYDYNLGDYTKMDTNYYRLSEEIDPSEFKSFEKVNIIE